MKTIFMGIIAALLLAVAVPAQARTIVNVEPYGLYVCTVTYDDGFRDLEFCPDNWPPATMPLGVTCLCEHLTPFSDTCEVFVNQYINTPRYGYTRVGAASIFTPPQADAPFVQFSCPQGTPPNLINCTVRATVTAPSGATGSAACRSF